MSQVPNEQLSAAQPAHSPDAEGGGGLLFVWGEVVDSEGSESEAGNGERDSCPTFGERLAAEMALEGSSQCHQIDAVGVPIECKLFWDCISFSIKETEEEAFSFDSHGGDFPSGTGEIEY